MDHASFSDFALAEPILLALAALGFATPTPVQRLALKPQLEGRDLLGVACTGSGKTAAYGLPLLNALLTAPRPVAPRRCRALVLAPTRELAQQIVVHLRAIAGRSGPRICAVVGGLPRQRQIGALARGAEIVVATPGRLIDLMRARALGLEDTRHLVIDEADRMLDLGFLEPVRRIAADLAPERQTVMFSATMPPPVAALAAQLLRDPVRAEVSPPPGAERLVTARAEIVPAARKHRRLLEIVARPEVASAIVFCRTRRGADALGRTLALAGVAHGVMHAERSQKERTRTLDRFRAGRIGVLVATDLVARGIDVPGVSHVVNFDLPDQPESYIHRIGRTGRAGARGEAVTLCAPAEIAHLRRIERATGQALLPPMCRRCRVATRNGRLPPGRPFPGCRARGAETC